MRETEIQPGSKNMAHAHSRRPGVSFVRSDYGSGCGSVLLTMHDNVVRGVGVPRASAVVHQD
jgi:hypothetical protein